MTASALGTGFMVDMGSATFPPKFSLCPKLLDAGGLLVFLSFGVVAVGRWDQEGEKGPNV